MTRVTKTFCANQWRFRWKNSDFAVQHAPRDWGRLMEGWAGEKNIQGQELLGKIKQTWSGETYFLDVEIWNDPYKSLGGGKFWPIHASSSSGNNLIILSCSIRSATRQLSHGVFFNICTWVYQVNSMVQGEWQPWSISIPSTSWPPHRNGWFSSFNR